MKTFYAILIFLVSLKGFGQNSKQDYGIGMLICNTTYPLVFYKKSFDKVPVDTLKFVDNKNGTTTFLRKINLKPYGMSFGETDEEAAKHDDLGRFSASLTFRVLENKKNFFLVVINEKTNEKLYLKKEKDATYYNGVPEATKHNCGNCNDPKFNDKRYIYESWDDYLRRVEYISKINPEIFDVPGGDIIYETKDNEARRFKVLEANGEWIKVKKSDRDSENSFNGEGWMKWLEDGKKTIEIIEIVLI
ncbi:hypothetical protein [Soonwooa sp.]|uniref:hypothetical protein n=1 Tax=Soonwooa sp. TaxID=1938592 RepID=UPI002637D6E6|nr:hypothetical protein [Soonwooa sp.]